MKTRVLSLSGVLFLIVLITGCLKPAAPSAVVLPTGNFIGTFTRLHLNLNNNKIDTTTAIVTLSMTAASGYSVGGDTSHHAASHGSYVVDGVNIAFSDQTLPSATAVNPPVPTKTHLNGVYQYAYSTTTLQIQQVGDTLIYSYNLKAQ